MIEGSLRYSSHWTHEGLNQSRRDDLEMLGYCILEMLKGEDLWSEISVFDERRNANLTQTEFDV